MKQNKFAPEYKHVVHATEEKRRERYQGCVSRQTLRAQLRQEAKLKGSDGRCERANYEYRRLMHLPEPR